MKYILGGTVSLNAVIGAGAYGVVYRGFCHKRNVSVAVKALPLNGGPSCDQHHHQLSCTGEAVECISGVELDLNAVVKNYASPCPLSQGRPRSRLYREVALHAKVHSHPNVVTIYALFESHDTLYVVMEYFARGDLFHAITELHWYVHNDDMIASIYNQLLSAVGYCHSQGVYHCDLKPENVLVSNDGTRVVISDFGLATSQLECQDYGCGSSFYMSPERLDTTTVKPSTGKRTFASVEGFSTPKADVWALGIVLLNLTCGRNPWKRASIHDASYRAFLKDGYFLERIMPISPKLAQFLKRVFASPSRRPSIEEARILFNRIGQFSAIRKPFALHSPIHYPQKPQHQRPLVNIHPPSPQSPGRDAHISAVPTLSAMTSIPSSDSICSGVQTPLCPSPPPELNSKILLPPIVIHEQPPKRFHANVL